MSESELQANLSTAHLVGHINYFIDQAQLKGDKTSVIVHLKALIRACELNPFMSHWKDEYILKLKSYE
jgi:hypothetical protein